MSEQWPTSGSHESDAEPDEGSSSLNGADPGDAAEAPDASAEGTAVEQVGEPGSEPASEPERADDGAAFVNELVRAMQTTASAERARTGEDTERRRQGHIDEVRTRETAQADKIRELAADDLKAIETWAEGEMQRIQAERKRRATDLNNDLETSLSEHHALIDREIAGVEAAIAAYRIEVDTFFDGLVQQSDPVLIAQQAARRPVFPSLDTSTEGAVAPEGVAAPVDVAVAAAPEEAPAVAAAESESLAAVEPVAPTPTDGAAPDESADGAFAGTPEPAVIAVMAPSAETEAGESWTVPTEASPESPESTEPVAAEPVGAASQAGTGSLINAVPVHRPMSWLRRDSNEGDRSNPEG